MDAVLIRTAFLCLLLLPIPAFAASVQQLIYSSDSEGSKVFLDYDDATLVATGFSVTTGASGLGSTIFMYKVQSVALPHTTTVAKATAVMTVLFPSPIQGTNATWITGASFINFGITGLSVGSCLQC